MPHIVKFSFIKEIIGVWLVMFYDRNSRIWLVGKIETTWNELLTYSAFTHFGSIWGSQKTWCDYTLVLSMGLACKQRVYAWMGNYIPHDTLRWIFGKCPLEDPPPHNTGHCGHVLSSYNKVVVLASNFYLRPLLASGYCRCLCVRPSVRVSPSLSVR